MRWDPNHRSDDVIDQRGARGPSAAGFGGAGILVWLLSRFGLPGLLLGGVVLAAAYFFTPSSSDSSSGDRSNLSASQEQAGNGDETARFVGFVLDDVQTTWERVFAEKGRRYSHAKLVLFSGATRSGCGVGSAQVGPFYCPNDRRVYIDLDFYRELARRFGAPGDFAQAYVIAHEVGHHVQNLLGEMSERSQVRGRERQNAASIQTELQADCYAGVWAHSTEQRDLLSAGDVEEGLRAAAAVGDDTLQRETQGRVSPETWTHGSSEQRVHWFKRGYTSGTLDACDTRGESAR
ncbi:MAG TPA: neutral zinc metallopeptidase [Polyangiaceae bacterium]|jgi:predicted metalloprotease|nr:neutral zinc metallopeptidase [Polyangiaceae bacterium]